MIEVILQAVMTEEEEEVIEDTTGEVTQGLGLKVQEKRDLTLLSLTLLVALKVLSMTREATDSRIVRMDLLRENTLNLPNPMIKMEFLLKI